jgi:DNA-binding transcriptional regulator YiaG
VTGEEVRAARHKLGITQTEFAQRVGVERNTVTRWELGLLRVGRTAAILIRLLAQQARKPRRKG